MSGTEQKATEIRYCKSCGKKLIRQYYFMGYCATCHSPGDQQLVEDAKAAKKHGMSYGNYMAAKREGRVK